MKKTRTYIILAIIMFIFGSEIVKADITPVPFTKVKIQDNFWAKRIEINRRVTIPYDFRKCEETGRIDNFAKAGGLMKGKFQGIRFDDSDVFKVIEGAAYTLSVHPDKELENYLDALIDKIAAAQEDDGYIFTTRTIDPNNPEGDSGSTRWSNLAVGHELYNVGHMYEAAVAYYQATGKRKFLNVAIKNADLIDSVFGPGKNYGVPGHQEIEIGLVKLYEVTGSKKYLNLAKFFLDNRGKPNNRDLYGEYSQDHKPVTQQTQAVGHAVRAAYMYSAMADVASITHDTNFITAIDRIWNDVVSSKIYITGSIGAKIEGEAFDKAYKLPNKDAYNETCAAIANAMWNHRLFMLKGHAKYMDVLEVILYNGFLSGVSLSGDKFFYPNPLESDGHSKFNHGSSSRQHWFGCSCCPTNIVRFIPSIPGYIYANDKKNIFVNLYIGSQAEIDINGNSVDITQKTDYPWDGKVNITLEPDKNCKFALNLRVPAWLTNSPLPSDLYEFDKTMPAKDKLSLKINGKMITDLKIDNGYIKIDRKWKKNDKIELVMPLSVRKVKSHPNVQANTGKLALMRGPVVYCFEEIDNTDNFEQIYISKDSVLKSEYDKDLLSGIVKINVINADKKFTAVPYYAWNNRGPGKMKVWAPQACEHKNKEN